LDFLSVVWTLACVAAIVAWSAVADNGLECVAGSDVVVVVAGLDGSSSSSASASAGPKVTMRPSSLRRRTKSVIGWPMNSCRTLWAGW